MGQSGCVKLQWYFCELATANNRCLHFCSERASSQRWVFIQTTGIYHGDGHGYSPNTRALATQGGAVRTESSEKQVQGTHTVGIACELKSSERTKYSDTYPPVLNQTYENYISLSVQTVLEPLQTGLNFKGAHKKKKCFQNFYSSVFQKHSVISEALALALASTWHWMG